ncbi:FHA domain-containing protein [Calothrix sp. 336/3]|uniref:FHA domain-containing protein n=1 Tax=Calothrix sp. 336/3 TaxID=1337936 RepID=UPI0004E4568B|nr:FHA domain-containing protein [Calothrix sp. 336/3]AKG21086.1 hypothetical protein IJ00_07055 [Calothrix sp. 336/3]
MAANRCPNSQCELFNRVLPNNIKDCPMCGTALGNAVAVSPRLPVIPKPQVVEPSPVIPTPQVVEPSPVIPTPQVVKPPQYTKLNPTSSQSHHQTVLPVEPIVVSQRPTLKLHHTSGKEIAFCGDEGNLGRRSPKNQVIPEIDLTGIAHEGIISRVHARIYWDYNQNAYILIDQSRNGTYLNGIPLSTGLPYRLNDGDYLQLGQDSLVCFYIAVTE